MHSRCKNANWKSASSSAFAKHMDKVQKSKPWTLCVILLYWCKGKKVEMGPIFQYVRTMVFLRYYSNRKMIWEDEMGCNRTVGRHVIIFGYWGTNNTDLFKKKRSPFLALGAPKHLSLAVLEVTVKSVDENLNLFYALHHGPTLKNGDSE